MTHHRPSYRRFILGSTALVAAALALPAHAQDADLPPPASTGSAEFAIDDPQVVISQPGTPTTARDPENINGVGQMVIDSGGGSVGLCTGTLINPRMVLFAAHCANTRPAGAYGVGGTPMSFGFSNNNLPALLEWLFGETAGQTNRGNALYNVNQVSYHPDSLLPSAQRFLYGDVAIATLDTPTRDIPTWAILLSALPAPDAIDGTTGTGYHVTVTGYGRNGVGTTGDSGAIDYRRRVAENFLGILGSINDTNAWLFGTNRGLPQNLYQIDFDDPRRDNGTPSPFDFNLFKDKALPNEGSTAGGDSGGPLILDQTFDEKVILGVLSGGTRYFGAQPSSSYGTTSFYQPLYLYWDWIAQNNPYRYVTTRDGNGNWTDPNHWLTMLDPSYRIIDADGNLVAGVPTTPGAGAFGEDSASKFGELCFRSSAALEECVNLATGVYTINGEEPPATAQTGDGVSIAAADAGVGRGVAVGSGLVAETTTHGEEPVVTTAEVSAEPDLGTFALPTPTLANGLPGATGFVPNNSDPTATTLARYFDVTLAGNGTTTLGSTVTIDRLTVAGANTTLNVASAGSLTSLIDISQMIGTVNVNGVLATPGDYFLFAGLLTGAGQINTPFFNSLAGMIAPGTMGGIGTLTFNGNIMLASQTRLLIDLGPNGTADRIVVRATDDSEGIAAIDGFVGFSPVAGYRLRDGDSFTILTAEGGVEGTLDSAPLSAILFPELTYTANAVRVEIEAGLYLDVVDPNSTIQTSFARLLDQNRTVYSRFADLFGELDLQNQATIRTQLEALAPRAQPMMIAQGTVAMDTVSRFFRDRVSNAGSGSQPGGTYAMYGKPIQLAAAAANSMPTDVRSDVANGMLLQESASLPDDVAIYLAGGYIDGSGVGLPAANPGGRNDFDGYFVAGGVEHIGATRTIGFGMSYAKLDGDATQAPVGVRSEAVQGTLYAATTGTGVKFDAQVSAGVFDVRSERSVGIGQATFDLRARDRAFTFSAEGGVGIELGNDSFAFVPRASVRYAHLGFTNTVERGGGPALQYDLGDYDSLQSRVGLTAKVKSGTFRPFVSANYVHEFDDRPAAFGANFVNGVGPQAVFALATTDRDWAEVSGGVTLSTGNVDFSLAAETTIERSDFRNQTYRGALTFRF